MHHHRPVLVATALLIALAGCARQTAQAPSTAGAVAAAPIAAPPVAPEGYTASLSVPPRDASGQYRTINHGLSAAGAVWHLRSALNVAALGCRGPQTIQLIADYNRLLTAQKAPLAKALKTLSAELKASQGAKWQDGQDRQMTRLYNFFALPQAQDRFCTTASAIAAQAIATPPAAFPDFAPTALAALEAPFTDYLAQVDGYRTELAAWQRSQADGTPRLAYADLDRVIAWAPAPRASRYADARPRR